MTPVVASLLTFLAVILACVSVVSLVSDLFLRNRSRVSRRLDEEFRRGQRAKAQKSSLFKDLQKLAAEPFGNDPEGPKSWRERLDQTLEQSGLEWSVSRLFTTSAVACFATGLLGLIVRGWLVGLIAAVVGAAVPFVYLHITRNRRLEALRRQLPDAYDLMARALRAGQTIPQTMQGVADEFTQPIAGEFSYCYEQQNLGLPTESALRDLSRRTGLMEVNIFVVAVVVQRQVGGNLAEMLERLAQMVRERYRIRGSIRTLTAEGRMQAGILMALPPAMFVAMLVLNRAYALVLFDYPWLLVGVVVSMGIGALWIRRIINFDF